MMPPGACSRVSDTARMLAATAPAGLSRAGRRRDELLEEPERFARAGQRGDPAQRVERARAMRRDLGLELLARPELVEDLANALDARGRERRRRREQRGELGPQAG